jgi:hypothetical protein
LLAELALDAKKNANQGGRQGPGKPKDKKKKKDHRKAKDSEVCITGLALFLFIVANVVLYIIHNSCIVVSWW